MAAQTFCSRQSLSTAIHGSNGKERRCSCVHMADSLFQTESKYHRPGGTDFLFPTKSQDVHPGLGILRRSNCAIHGFACTQCQSRDERSFFRLHNGFTVIY